MCPFSFLEEIDMTEEHSLLTGSVPKKLAAFAFPLLLANILQSFYNVVDMLVVGQIVGDTGLAAILITLLNCAISSIQFALV